MRISKESGLMSGFKAVYSLLRDNANIELFVITARGLTLPEMKDDAQRVLDENNIKLMVFPTKDDGGALFEPNDFKIMMPNKNEEKLSRTQELNTAKVQALKELGYTEINEDNAKEVLEKIKNKK